MLKKSSGSCILIYNSFLIISRTLASVCYYKRSTFLQNIAKLT